MGDGYFHDPSTSGKSSSRLCAVICALAAVGLSFVLVFKSHPGEAVTVICAVLVATWGGYTANSTARVIMTKGVSLNSPGLPGAGPGMPEPTERGPVG